MLVDPNTLMYGVAPKILQQLAKRLVVKEYCDVEDICEGLGVPESEARPVINALIQDGYLSQNPMDAEEYLQSTLETKETEWFIPTPKVNRLNLATIGKGISRAEADKLLSEVIDAARDIKLHQANYGGWYVAKLYVFGSYLDKDKSHLGDLDIAYTVNFDKAFRSQYDKNPILYVEERTKKGRKALVRLNCHKTQKISLHDYEGVELLNTECVQVYSHDDPLNLTIV